MNAEFKSLLITAVVIPAVTVVVTKAVEWWGDKLPHWFTRLYGLGVCWFRKWGTPMAFSMSFTALVLILWWAQRPSIKHTGLSIESGGTITIPLPQDRKGHLVTIDLDGWQYNHRLWIAAVHNGYNDPGYPTKLVQVPINGGPEPDIIINALGHLVIGRIPQKTPPVVAHYTILDVGD